MSSLNPFKRRKEKKEEISEVDPQIFAEPSDFEGFMRRGWAYHSKGEQDKAEADFRRAISFSPESVDANYAMGLVFKSQGRNEDAIEIFKKTMQYIKDGKIEDYAKSEMMRRLTLGHINELTTGDWNLEDQIWRQE